MEELDLIFLEIDEKMDNALKSYNLDLYKITVGRANPQILNSIKVNYYNSLTPLLEIANVSVPEPRQLLIKPYEISIIKNIIEAINSAALGLNPVNEGQQLRIIFPEITTERRKELIKFFGKYTEKAKIMVRTTRQNANKSIKKLELSEDREKQEFDKVQDITNSYIEKINNRSIKKQKELMEI